jgi:hypothetical protein
VAREKAAILARVARTDRQARILDGVRLDAG